METQGSDFTIQFRRVWNCTPEIFGFSQVHISFDLVEDLLEMFEGRKGVVPVEPTELLYEDL